MKKWLLARYSLIRCLLRYQGVRWVAWRIWYWFKKKTGFQKWRTPAMSWPTWSDFYLNTDSQQVVADLFSEKSRRFFFRPSQREQTQSSLLAYDELCRKNSDEGGLTDATDVIEQADNVLAGKIPCFGSETATVENPPRWHQSILQEGFDLYDQKEDHWTEIKEYGKGDIKTIWESSRFLVVYPLVRAYYRTGNEKYAESFWNWLESWYEENLPNTGVHWICGQELALKVKAFSFALYGFASAKASTSERQEKLLTMLLTFGKRIRQNIDYAFSQKNNHSVAEATGLLTVALLFPDYGPSRHWARKGLEILSYCIDRLCYDDGGFAQNSLNYQRAVLNGMVWSYRLAQIHEKQLMAWGLGSFLLYQGDDLENPKSQTDKSPEDQTCRQPNLHNNVYHRLLAAANLFDKMMCPVTGNLPNYGNNDGNEILPLSSSPYADYRPIIANLFCLLGKGPTNKAFQNNIYREAFLWLYGLDTFKKSLTSKQSAEDVNDPFSGTYHTHKNGRGQLFFRPVTYHHRPAHADQMHVDLRFDGLPIAIDPGTYSYNYDKEQFDLADTRCHNAMTLNRASHMDRLARYIWDPWYGVKTLSSQIFPEESRPSLGDLFQKKEIMKTSRGGYENQDDKERLKDLESKEVVSFANYRLTTRRYTHDRSIVALETEGWLVLDRFVIAAPEAVNSSNRVILHWLIEDYPFTEKGKKLLLETPRGRYQIEVQPGQPSDSSLVRGHAESFRGWQCKTYLHKAAALSWEFEATIPPATGEVTFATTFFPVTSQK
ncbi:MAG: heparinase II/III family protein [Pirellulaceae bacterium]|nr:heparinase II/III family protein [Pirellulaceae bacterium]